MSDEILIVGGGLLQVPAVEQARQMGLRTLVTDQNPQAPCATLVRVSAVRSEYPSRGS